MPPGPAYNWFCVLNSAAEILSHAARHRAAQLTPAAALAANASPRKRKRRRTEEPVEATRPATVHDEGSIAKDATLAPAAPVEHVTVDPILPKLDEAQAPPEEKLLALPRVPPQVYSELGSATELILKTARKPLAVLEMDRTVEVLNQEPVRVEVSF
ncbi:hypothetical protein NLJ89_g10775 [Agrocybe chaxingu]|uniref:Uncharacterized protein n=1 Tax=Agrocybe chaxingu TaxID=84603 RepID=A0A9W8JR50_9AGAR|nr:hypothetical protein NLJ89_g10775 [Agrocybe chaxingu]